MHQGIRAPLKLACTILTCPMLTGRTLPDSYVRITSTPREGGVQTERGIFMSKVASFGPCPPSIAAAVSRPMQLSNKNDACEELEAASGAILLADRGTCNFLNKTRRAFDAGASALVVGNLPPDSTEFEELPVMGCPDGWEDSCKNVSIPAVIIYSGDKQQLKRWLETSESEKVILYATIYQRAHATLDPSSVFIWMLATCTVIAGSYLAVIPDRSKASGGHSSFGSDVQDDDDGIPMQDITMVHALCFVFMASGMLVLLFFFIRQIIIFLVVMYCVASTSAITNVYAPLLWHCVPALKRRVWLPFLEQVSLSHIVCFFAGITIAAVWYALRFSGLVWPLHDLMSVSLCLQILSTVRFQDIKVSTVLLSLALLYDIFWVFISPLLFSENVMIATATGKGHTWSNTTDTPPAEMIPMLLVVPKVLDWAGGVTLLGLGDVVLPGLLVSFSLRVDVIKGYGWWGGYFGYMVCGYAVGMALAIFASMVMHMGQPALLYLVPCTLFPFLSLAYSRGELQELWQGLETARPSSMELLCPGSGDSSAGEDGGGRCEGGEEGGMEDAELSRHRRPGDRLVEQEGEKDPNGAGGGGSGIGAERKGESRQRLLASKDKR